MEFKTKEINEYLNTLEEISAPAEIEQKRLFFQTHSSGFISFFITNDSSRVISSNLDHAIRVWDIKAMSVLFVLLGHTEYIETMSITDDDIFLVSGSKDKTIRIWNLIKKHLIEIINHDYAITSVNISKSKAYIVFMTPEKNILYKIWDIMEKKHITYYIKKSGVANCLAISNKENFIMTGHRNGMICKMIFPKGKYQIVLEKSLGSVRFVLLTADDKYAFILTYCGTVTQFNISKKRKEWTLEKKTWAYSDCKLFLSIPNDLLVFYSKGKFRDPSNDPYRLLAVDLRTHQEKLLGSSKAMTNEFAAGKNMKYFVYQNESVYSIQVAGIFEDHTNLIERFFHPKEESRVTAQDNSDQVFHLGNIK